MRCYSKNDPTLTPFFVPSDLLNVQTLFFAARIKVFCEDEKWNDLRIHQIMSNEDGKSMGLALILPLLLYIVYLIREIRVSLGMSLFRVVPFQIWFLVVLVLGTAPFWYKVAPFCGGLSKSFELRWHFTALWNSFNRSYETDLNIRSQMERNIL